MCTSCVTHAPILIKVWNMFFLKMIVVPCSGQTDIFCSATSVGFEIAGIVKTVALVLAVVQFEEFV